MESHEHYSLPARFLYYLGKLWLRSLPGQLSVLIVKSLFALLTIRKGRFPTEFRQIIAQVHFTGIEAIPLVSLIAILLGSLTVTQAMTLMTKVGFGDFFGSLMVIVIIRELGPVLTAFLVAGRTGSALATYLANMRVESEVEALETMGIDPVRYLVMPAMVGGVLAMFILNTLFGVLAVVSGFGVAKALTTVIPQAYESKLMWEPYLHSILQALKPTDVLMLVIKPIIFGAIIAANACHFGLSTRHDKREVPQATSKSVVYSFLFVVIADLVLVLFYVFDYMRGFSSVI